MEKAELIEDSYDESFKNIWGDLGNIFFRMYDLCFEDDIRAKLKKCNELGVEVSLVLDTDAEDLVTIYSDVDYLQAVVKEYKIVFFWKIERNIIICYNKITWGYNMKEVTKYKLLSTIRYLGDSFYYPFISLYLVSCNLLESNIGFILSITPLVSIFTNPIYTKICKKNK